MENLRKKFIICKTITKYDYDLGWKIFNHVCNNPEAVKEFKDYSVCANYNIAKENDWITSLGCRRLHFYETNDNLTCEVTTSELKYGDYGIEKELKWNAKIEIPWEFLTYIEKEIEATFDRKCHDMYKVYLDTIEDNWVESMKKFLTSQSEIYFKEKEYEDFISDKEMKSLSVLNNLI